MLKNRSHSVLLLLPILVLGSLSSGCGANPTDVGNHELAMASLDQMPDEVQSAPVSVQQAYQFAVANSDTMKQIPCYCGCGGMGHTSNYACYVAGVEADRTLKYESHALGCSICVDITQDTMRLLKQGKTVQEVKAYVDDTYSKYGPSNIP